MASNSGKTKGRTSSKNERRKHYKAPKLVQYGSVAKLTAGTGGTHFDPGQSVPSKVGKG